MANINSKYDSDIYFTITFKGLFKIIFFRNSQFQKLFNNLFAPEISIQKFEFGFIQFNKIFIQFENQGMEDHYLLRMLHRVLLFRKMFSSGSLLWNTISIRWINLIRIDTLRHCFSTAAAISVNFDHFWPGGLTL